MRSSWGKLRSGVSVRLTHVHVVLAVMLAGWCLSLVARPCRAADGGPASSSSVRGDLNCDGRVDLTDIEAFAFALVDRQGWCRKYQRSVADLLARGDFDRDGALTVGDIAAFAEVLQAALDAAESSDASGEGIGDQTTVDGGMALDGMTEATIDLDVDSNNDNGVNVPDRSADEDLIESDPNFAGKYVPIWTGATDWVPLILDIRPVNPVQGQSVRYRVDYPDTARCNNNNCSGCFQIWADPNTFVESGDALWHQIWFAGDMNCSGTVTYADINLLVTALSSGRAAYEALEPNCNFFNADCNFDGLVNYADVDAFIPLINKQPPTIRPLRLLIKGLATHAEDNVCITAYGDLDGDGQLDPNATDTVQVRIGDCCATYNILGQPPGY